MDNKEINNDELSFANVNFSTHFNCVCDSAGIHEKFRDQACFSSIFSLVKKSARYNIFMCPDPAVLLKKKNNYCPFNMDDIKSWLDYICSIVNARYSITDDSVKIKFNTGFNNHEYIECPCYNLCFEINDEPNKKHKFALTAIRYLYEGPMNVFLFDVFRLKHIEQFADETFLNLHNLVTCTVDNTRNYYTGHGHQLTIGNAKLISDEELRDKLCNDSYLHDTFEKTSCFNIMKVIPLSYKFYFWESDKSFNEERLPIYLYNYELLCKERERNNNKSIKNESICSRTF